MFEHYPFFALWHEYMDDVAHVPHTAVSLAGFTLLSAFAGPSIGLPLRSVIHPMPLTIWSAYLAPSTLGHKTALMGAVDEVYDEVIQDANARPAWRMNPASLIEKLAERDGQGSFFTRDEAHGWIRSVRYGRFAEDIPETLVRAFDAKKLDNDRVKQRGKENSVVVHKPYLPIFMTGVDTAFADNASIEMVESGVLTRFALSLMPENWPTRPIRPLTAETRRLFIALIRAVERFRVNVASTKGPYDRPPAVERGINGDLEFNIDSGTGLAFGEGVLDAFDGLSSTWSAEARQAMAPQCIYPVLVRFVDTVLRSAALAAIDRTSLDTVQEAHDIVIDLDDWQFALSELLPSKRDTVALFSKLGASDDERKMEDMITFLRVNATEANEGWIDHYRLYTTARVTQPKMKVFLQTLVDSKQIEARKGVLIGAGRPPLQYRLRPIHCTHTGAWHETTGAADQTID